MAIVKFLFIGIGAIICLSSVIQAKENEKLLKTSDMVSTFLMNMRDSIVRSQEQYDILQTLKCVYSEITLPSIQKLQSVGTSQFGKHLLAETFKSFAIETNLITIPFVESSENYLLKARFDRCMTGDDSAVNQGRSSGYGGGYGYDYKKKDDKSSLGFALLGLKVVGALAAFLIWDLTTNP